MWLFRQVDVLLHEMLCFFPGVRLFVASATDATVCLMWKFQMHIDLATAYFLWGRIDTRVYTQTLGFPHRQSPLSQHRNGMKRESICKLWPMNRLAVQLPAWAVYFYIPRVRIPCIEGSPWNSWDGLHQELQPRNNHWLGCGFQLFVVFIRRLWDEEPSLTSMLCCIFQLVWNPFLHLTAQFDGGSWKLKRKNLPSFWHEHQNPFSHNTNRILRCPRNLVNGSQMGYNLLINGIY